jgi:hypothetical protein
MPICRVMPVVAMTPTATMPFGHSDPGYRNGSSHQAIGKRVAGEFAEK